LSAVYSKGSCSLLVLSSDNCREHATDSSIAKTGTVTIVALYFIKQILDDTEQI
jgi:hypothetical protein